MNNLSVHNARTMEKLMEKQRITIKTVAEECGVSIATVSRVLNDNYYVSPDIKKNVLETVNKLGYVPNSVARNLKLNTSGIIGYITSDISNGYHITIAKAVEDVIRSSNYNLVVCSTGNNAEAERQYLKLLMGKNVDALIINTCGANDDFVLKANESIPMVLVNRRLNTPGFHGDFADCNNVLGMYLLTKDLLNHGHKDIYLVEGPANLSNSQERLEGFSKAMAESGITNISSYPFRYQGDYSLNSGFDAIAHMLTLPHRPTAVLAANNTMTLGVLKALKHFGISAPADISIAGFNGIDHIELLETRPTVADYDPYKIGQAAGRAILERIHDNTIDNREYIFSPVLVHGNAVTSI